MAGVCRHIDAVTDVKHAKERKCEECVKMGARWVHLRTCQDCGVTLCCDSSPNQHATKHARASHHPVVASAEPGERWLYCYPDDEMAEYKEKLSAARGSLLLAWPFSPTWQQPTASR